MYINVNWDEFQSPNMDYKLHTKDWQLPEKINDVFSSCQPKGARAGIYNNTFLFHPPTVKLLARAYSCSEAEHGYTQLHHWLITDELALCQYYFLRASCI